MIDHEDFWDDMTPKKVFENLFWEPDPLQIVQIDNVIQVEKINKDEVPIADRIYFRVYLRADSFSTVYQNEPYGLLESIGDLGGIFSIFFAIFTFLVPKIVNFYYTSALLEETYQV